MSVYMFEHFTVTCIIQFVSPEAYQSMHTCISNDIALLNKINIIMVVSDYDEFLMISCHSSYVNDRCHSRSSLPM